MKPGRLMGVAQRRPERRQGVILVCLLLWSIISFLFVSHFLFRAAEVDGDSMRPTLVDGQRMLIDRTAYWRWAPSAGDIVAIQQPGDDLIVKRVIACPGDVVRIPDAHVTVNGRKLPELYLAPGTMTQPGTLSTNPYAVQSDCYFVLGDNRGVSIDSRFFGAVRGKWIVGRVTGLWQACRAMGKTVVGL